MVKEFNKKFNNLIKYLKAVSAANESEKKKKSGWLKNVPRVIESKGKWQESDPEFDCELA